MSFKSLKEMVDAASARSLPLFEIVRDEDCRDRGISPEASFEKMRRMADAMREADESYDPDRHSPSGMVGGEAEKLRRAMADGRLLCGDFISRVMVRALRMGECNACMKRIVAAPTAGSCGVLPAVLISYCEHIDAEPNALVRALYVAGGVGEVIAERACISGAEGGCQAEIGSAGAMAAAAVTDLRGGSPEAVIHAAALVLKSMLGLVCDPVAGLVEVPCVKRNVAGAVNALTASDMAIAGIRSRIPPDEVIDAMREVGDMMSPTLRETGKGGLAATPTGQEIAGKMAQINLVK